jgi:hypothetical protein
MAGAHFFCETIDLSRPFPSDRPVTQPSWEFVWNRWLTASFRGIGLDFVCPPLLQVGQQAGGSEHNSSETVLECSSSSIDRGVKQAGASAGPPQAGGHKRIINAGMACFYSESKVFMPGLPANAPMHVVSLLWVALCFQGLCEERGLNDFDGSPYTVVLISRRNRLHVGPRYKARGINEYAEPANEIEVEQVCVCVCVLQL